MAGFKLESAGNDSAMEATAREMVIRELHDMPEIGILEVLDFVRFPKARLSQLSPRERFDRTWTVARRLVSEYEYGITAQDIAAEVHWARQEP